MTLYGESAKTKAGIISKGFLVGVQGFDFFLIKAIFILKNTINITDKG